MGLGGYMCIKLWFISKAAFDKATLPWILAVCANPGL